MDAFFGIMSIFGFIFGLVWLLRNKLLAKKAVKPAVLLILASFLVFSIAVAISPPAEEPEPPPGPAITDTSVPHDAEEEVPSENDSYGQETEGELAEDSKPEETHESSSTSPPPTAPTGQLIVHFIDVGQGDAILIQTPSQNILIDGGNRGTTVVNYLKAKGVNSLDLVIGTHPHADHLNTDNI